MQPGRIDRLSERCRVQAWITDDRAGPGAAQIGPAPNLLPKEPNAIIRHGARKCGLKTHKAVLNELADLSRTQRSQCRLWCFIRHLLHGSPRRCPVDLITGPPARSIYASERLQTTHRCRFPHDTGWAAVDPKRTLSASTIGQRSPQTSHQRVLAHAIILASRCSI